MLSLWSTDHLHHQGASTSEIASRSTCLRVEVPVLLVMPDGRQQEVLGTASTPLDI